MELIESVANWKMLRKDNRFYGKTIGFIPTMGALHAGHLSLINASQNQNHITVVSVFVNPSQFNDPTDFKNYPRDDSGDIKKLRGVGVDYLFMPKGQEIYPDQYQYRVVENNFSQKLCGKYRLGHFDGVLTVVMKLFQLIRPNRAYFGEKDYQQYLLIRKMTEAFFMDIEIHSCPTLREKDGLAMSSRNILLEQQEREKAKLFPKILLETENPKTAFEKLTEAGFCVDYVEDHDHRRYGAVRIGSVRLIDNVQR